MGEYQWGHNGVSGSLEYISAGRILYHGLPVFGAIDRTPMKLAYMYMHGEGDDRITACLDSWPRAHFSYPNTPSYTIGLFLIGNVAQLTIFPE